MQKLSISAAPEERMSTPNQPGYRIFNGYLTFAIGFTVACGFGLVGGNVATLCICCFILLYASYVIRDIWVHEIQVNFEKWKLEERTKEKKVALVKPKQIEIKYDFTSDDFDDAARAFLLPQVTLAKKTKSKVSGQTLVQTFLKNVR